MRRSLPMVCLVCAMLLILSGCINPSGSDGNRRAFTLKDLEGRVPIVYGEPHNYTLPENSTCSPSYKYELQWSFGLGNKIFADYGSYVDVWLVNGDYEDGASRMLVYTIGILIEGTFYKSSVYKIVEVNSTEYLGFVRFKAPLTPSCRYTLKIAFYSQNSSDGKWHNYGLKSGNEHEHSIDGIPINSSYKTSMNNKKYYDKLNNLVNYSQVRAKADELSAEYPGVRSIYAMFAAFDFVHWNITYTPDIGKDTWSAPKDTLSSRKGDCEDLAILFVSIIGALGGASRIFLTDKHVFSAVYAGNETNFSEIEKAASLYYGQELELEYIKDSFGYWIIADVTQSSYFGCLPQSGVPIGLGGWGFNSNVTTLDIIDVIPRK